MRRHVWLALHCSMFVVQDALLASSTTTLHKCLPLLAACSSLHTLLLSEVLLTYELLACLALCTDLTELMLNHAAAPVTQHELNPVLAALSGCAHCSWAFEVCRVVLF